MAYVVNAVWTVQPGKEEVVREAVSKLSLASRDEPGNRFYQAYEDPAEPSVVRFFEIYDDEAAYEDHGSSDHFKRYALELAIPALSNRERAFYQTMC